MPRLPTEWGRYREGIKSVVLDFLKDNRGQFKTLDEITRELKQTQGFLRDIYVVSWLAMEHGLKGEIVNALHHWRGEGHPIISSDEKGKGYVLCDPNDSRTPDYWDSKFRANETQREQIPKTERETDKQLFIWCIQHCEDAGTRNLMIKVALRHGIREEDL